MEYRDLVVSGWADYELLDSGDNKKLERYGDRVLIRPETQAIWAPAEPRAWARATAEFRWAEGKGSWRGRDLPEAWTLAWQDVRFKVRPTAFKHTGLFPEQAANWEWIHEKVEVLAQPKVLNLFGYTGIASIAAAQAGAQVTHVDASNQSNRWAKENAAMSGVPEGAIKYLLEDALKFVSREARRGSKYDGIILDPPAFGRGPKGEVWRIEESLFRLLAMLPSVLAEQKGAFLLLNGYAAGYSPRSFLQAVESALPEAQTGVKGEFGELHLRETEGDRVIPAGIYVRFSR